MGVSAATFAVSSAFTTFPADAFDEGGAMSGAPGVAPGPSGGLTVVPGNGVSGAVVPGGTGARAGVAAACGLTVCAPAVTQVPNVSATATEDAARLCQRRDI